VNVTVVIVEMRYDEDERIFFSRRGAEAVFRAFSVFRGKKLEVIDN
jgi:hypothetical protein